MKKCQKCGKTYDDSWGVCLSCRTKLLQASSESDIPAVQKEKTANKSDFWLTALCLPFAILTVLFLVAFLTLGPMGPIVAIFAGADFITSFNQPEKRIIPLHIKGKVINIKDELPIPDADITISYAIGGLDNSRFYEENFKPDNSGYFDIVMKKGGRYQIKAFSPGYYPYSHKAKTFFKNIIKMQPIIDPQPIEIKKGEAGLSLYTDEKLGFNFEKGSTTIDLNSADLLLDTKSGDKDGMVYMIRTNGDGGFIKIPTNYYENYKFYNTPLAPEKGYKKRMHFEIGNFFYFRTADGKHYGKMEISTVANNRLVSFEYVFQPEENNRNLEIEYPYEIPQEH